MNDTILFSYGVSRGRDTYGYNIVTLTSSAQGKKFRCMGGGYDMHGQVLGEYVQYCATQEQLHAAVSADDSLPVFINNDGVARVLGSSGEAGVMRLMRAIGWEVKAIHSFDRQGRVKATIGYNIKG